MSSEVEKRPTTSQELLVFGGALGRLREPRTGWRETLLLFFWLVALPLAAMVALKVLLGFFGPVLNLDLLLIYLGSVLLSRAIGRSMALLATLGALLVLAVHILMGVGMIFVFDPMMMLDYLRFIGDWPLGLLIGIPVVLLIAFATLYLGVRRISIGHARLWPAFMLLAAVLAADASTGTPFGQKLFGGNVATSSAKVVVKYYQRPWKPWGSDGSSAFGYVAQPGPSMASDLQGSALPARILSIAVEAYGRSADESFNGAIAKPFLDAVSPHYEVAQTTHASRGLTIAGEMRELCGVRIAAAPRKADAEKLQPQCVPGRLAARGYRTVGMHGNNGFFYSRNEIYPGLGFQEKKFHTHLRAQGGQDCPSHSFPGTCDRDAIRFALGEFGKSDREFVHLITLDTHFPFIARTPTDTQCPLGSKRAPQLCLYQNQVTTALATIGRAIRDARVKPDVIYVYGDHPPPFINANLRNFFVREEVPVFILKRRSAGQ